MLVERRGNVSLRWAFAGLAYALLLLGWVFASPLGATPDESAHLVRAAAAALGEWQGQPSTSYRSGPGGSAAQATLLNQQAQTYTIPASLVPPAACFAGRPNQDASCVYGQTPASGSGTVQAATYETTAPPGVYALAGAAMFVVPPQLLAPGYAARLALALLCALLLAGAAWAAAARGSLWPLAGVALAATPMVLFLGATVGAAGVAASAAVCFATSLLAFWLGPPRRGLSFLIGVSGAVLGLASAGGALALAVIIVAVLPLVQVRRLAAAGPLLGSILVVAGLIGGLSLAVQDRPLPAAHLDLAGATASVAGSLPDLLRQAVGVFGWSEVTLPGVAYLLWLGLTVVGVSAALLLGRWRDRLTLVLAAGGALAMAVFAVAFVLAPVGWVVSGAFLLPVLAVLPVGAGFVLQAVRLPARADALLAGLVVVAVQLLSLAENGRRYAVGRQGTFDLVDAARWAPPGGWMPWLAIAVAGGLLLLLALLPLSRQEEDEEAEGPLVVVDPISISR
jgi:hypothetical protein